MMAEPSSRQEEILDAAADVFATYGYEAGSMRRIAEQVGVTEPALYRHFPGKEAIFIALMRFAAGRVVAETGELIGRLRPEELRAQLLELIRDRRAVISRYAPVLRTVLSAMAHNQRFLEEYRAVIALPMRDHIARKAEEFDAVFNLPAAEKTRDARVRALMALVVGFFATSIVLDDEPDAAIVDAALRIMEWERYA